MGSSSNTTFYRYTQNEAITIFPQLLQPYLPYPNALYNRLLSPLNTPSRHCLFACTFPVSASHLPHDNFTILFSDRSRHLESQVWLFNPLVTKATPLSPAEEDVITDHAETLLHFLRDTQIPESSGWPFSSTLKFASVHESMALPLTAIAKKRNAVIYYESLWGHWMIRLSDFVASPHNENKGGGGAQPSGWTIARVPEDKLEIVIANSSIKRQKTTLMAIPSVCLLDERGEMAAWAFIGLDGSLCTLHVLEDYRGRGLAKLVARELLERYRKGEYFGTLGLGGENASGWVHAEVGEGNVGSEGVMKSLGATKKWRTGYFGLDIDML